MSARSAVDKKKCEIVVDKVEKKDLGKWRSKQKFHILDRNLTPTSTWLCASYPHLQRCADIINRHFEEGTSFK